MTYESPNERTKDFIKNIDLYFNQDGNVVLQEGRNIIKKVEYEKVEYVVKSFKKPNIFNKIVYRFFRKSKANKSYFNSIKISDFVPKAIGYIEFKKFGFITNSYFISEPFNYDFTIREALLDNSFPDRDGIFKAFAKFSFNLHKRDILHLDYSPGNILIKKIGSSYIFKIIDINRMQFKSLELNERVKNFSKLWAKDEDLTIIIKEYAQLMDESEDNSLEMALKYSQAHKNFKNFKKRVKGLKVVD